MVFPPALTGLVLYCFGLFVEEAGRLSFRPAGRRLLSHPDGPAAHGLGDVLRVPNLTLQQGDGQIVGRDIPERVNSFETPRVEV